MTTTKKALEKLVKGLEHLRQARTSLILTPEQAQALDALAERNEQAALLLREQLLEESARAQVAKSALKTIEARRAATIATERQEVHKKSDFTGYVVKVGGSYESGNR